MERLDLGRRAVALGEVEPHREDRGHAAVLGNDRFVRPGDLTALAVLRQPVPDLWARGDVAELLEEDRERRPLLGRDHDLAGVAADHLGCREAGHALAGVVEREDPPRAVELADHAEPGAGEHVDVFLWRKRLDRLRRYRRGHAETVPAGAQGVTRG